MKPTARARRILVLLLSLLGTAALFLPFAEIGTIFKNVIIWPLKSMMEHPALIAESPLYAILGASFFLVVPILVLQTRRLMVDRLSTTEIVAAYLLGTLAMVSVLGFGVLLAPPLSEWDAAIVISMAMCVATIVANVLLLIRNRGARVSPAASAEAFLLGAYISYTIAWFTVVYAASIDPLWESLGLGGYLSAVVCVGYRAAIVLLSRGERGSELRPGGAAFERQYP